MPATKVIGIRVQGDFPHNDGSDAFKTEVERIMIAIMDATETKEDIDWMNEWLKRRR